MKLETLLTRDRAIRVIGFDDAPFVRRRSSSVSIVGVICAETRFEGMVWGKVRQDGWNATDTICRLLLGKKFLPQLHILLLDGIGFGGFNIIDLPKLADKLQIPCVTVMRRQPNMTKIETALQRLPQPHRRLELMRRAGKVHAYPPFFFQACGEDPDIIAAVLQRLSDRGHVPEALRLAHLIGAAVVKGESGSSA